MTQGVEEEIYLLDDHYFHIVLNDTSSQCMSP